MSDTVSDRQLEAYLDEALAPAEMSAMERALREQPELAQRLAQIIGRRDAGVHSLGEIWRRHRVSCPTRQQLGSYLLGVLDEQASGYIVFHLETVGCRYCQANLEDLRERQMENQETVSHRRRKYFQSSAGYLKRSD